MKDTFRLGGILCLITSIILRWKSQSIVLPSSFGYSGDFWLSDSGQRLSIFNEMMIAAVILSGMAIMLSYLPIWGKEDTMKPGSPK